MPTLRSALNHYRQQQRISTLGVLAARRARFGSLDRLLAVVTAFQLAAGEDAVAAVPLILAEQNMPTEGAFTAAVEALLGSASDGRPMRSLLDYGRSKEVTDFEFDRIVSTQLRDVARQATAIEIAARPQITGYVRVLVPPSCSRCAILAGRVYRWNEGFLRHPNCDCQHVVSGSEARDLTSSPTRYFDSLDAADQNRIFTNAGAEAIRLGADPGKVVNARRGMAKAQVFGRNLDVTTEGSSRRAGNNVIRAELTTSGGKKVTGRVRLMPESILELSDGDRAEAARLLRRNGYVT